MYKNPLLEKIKLNKPSIGIGTQNPHEAELLAKVGFDWFWIDQMWTDNDWKEVQTLLWAGEAAGITPVLRIQSHPWVGYDHRIAVDLSRAQGLGAQFVMISYSEKKEIEEALVVAKDWHRRPMTVHPFKNADWDQEIDRMADQSFVIACAETKQTLEQAEEVISMPDLKMFRISASDGNRMVTGDKHPDFYNPKFWKYVSKIVDLCDKHGVYVGMGTSYAYTMKEMRERVKRLVDAGIKMILVQMTPFILQVALTEFLEGVRSDAGW